MTITRKTNGYKISEELENRLYQFEEFAKKAFGDALVNIEYFYYGERLVMTDIRLSSKEYAHFNIKENRISLCGYTCDKEQLKKFIKLTLNDECYKGVVIK